MINEREKAMKKYNELQLVEERKLRESVISRTEVLDKVGNLLLLPNTEYATTAQVAEYYNVTQRHIESLIVGNRDELESDGFGVRNANDFITELNFGNKVTKQRGKFLVKFADDNVATFAPRGVNLFPKRAILRIGMLLQNSEIAKDVRTRLLDIIHDTQEQAPMIIQGVVNEINEEKQLMLDRVEAEMQGDYPKVCEINAQLFALKNKRIKELEDLNENITTHSLTIMESRSVINRIVRTIAMKRYGGMFGKAWNEMYSKINYKLHINIKNRKRDKNKTYLSTLTEDETYEVEKIVRNWAVDIGLDLDELLKIA